MNHILSKSLLFGSMALMLTSCYEDKGNYEYKEIEEISVVFPENIRVMEGAEPVQFSPVVTSSLEGELKDGNPNYEFSCRINMTNRDANGASQRWFDINPEHTKDVNCSAEIPANNYKIWYIVKNKNTGVQYNFTTDLTVLSTTSEGWLVLSNNGANKEARLDILFTDSKGKEIVRTGIWEADAPKVKEATELVYNPSNFSYGDRIFLCSKSGAYKLNSVTLQLYEVNNIRYSEFADPNTPGEVVVFHPIYASSTYGHLTQVCITTEGNAHAVHNTYAGAAFEFPMNTDAVGNNPTYKLAPFMASGQVRGKYNYIALFYDITNKRFMGFNHNNQGNAKKLLFEPKGDETQKFDWVTGMDIVDMESTMFSDGEAFAVLQDAAGKRHVYGIYLGNNYSTIFKQDKIYEVDAPDFDTATDYAFHSQYPFMFYAKGNKVYNYDRGTSKIKATVDLPAGERITKIKFNLWRNWDPANSLSRNDEEFIGMQHELCVASTTGAANGGIVRFYKIDTDGTMTLHKEYKGFGQEIVDVTYRERRK